MTRGGTVLLVSVTPDICHVQTSARSIRDPQLFKVDKPLTEMCTKSNTLSRSRTSNDQTMVLFSLPCAVAQGAIDKLKLRISPVD